MCFHDSELLERLQLISLPHVLLIRCAVALSAPLKASLSSSPWSLFLYKIDFVSVYDSFIFALDLEVISDEM